MGNVFCSLTLMPCGDMVWSVCIQCVSVLSLVMWSVVLSLAMAVTCRSSMV